MAKLFIAHLNAEQVREQWDDLRMVEQTSMTADNTHAAWFYGFESADGDESPLSGPFACESVARMAARDLVNGCQ